MTRAEIKELIEDVTNVAVNKFVQPLDKRLTKIETTMEIKKRNSQRLREIIPLSMAVPATIYTVLNLVGIV